MAVEIILSVPVGETAPESINLSRARGDRRDDTGGEFRPPLVLFSLDWKLSPGRRSRSYRALSGGSSVFQVVLLLLGW